MKTSRMLSGLLVSGVLLSSALCAQSSYAQAWTGNVNLSLGKKALKESDWKPADQQTEAGIAVDFRPKSWPVNMAVDYSLGTGEGTVLGVLKVESRTSEFNVGIRKIWEGFSLVRPFIGGGAVFVSAESKASALAATVTINGAQSASASGSGTGYWVGGGVYWTFVEVLNIGLSAKYSSAKVTVSGVEAETGGTHYGLLIGWHWGGGG